MLNGSMRFLLVVQYPLLLFPVPASFDQVQSTSDYENETADDGQGKRPTDIIVLPIGHPVAAVAPCTKYDDGYDTTEAAQS